jgi:probable HAF family extracellular repeat protein
MKSRKLTCLTAMTLFALLALPVRLAAQEPHNNEHPRYRVRDLGTLGGTFSLAGGINNRGEVEGISTLPGDATEHAFVWRKGLMTDLGTLGGPNSGAAWRPSDRGEVGGAADTSTPDPLGQDFCGFGTNLICLPFVWHRGVLTPLPTLGGRNGIANDFNNRGQVVGRSENATPDQTCEPPTEIPQFKPVIWKDGEIEEELPTLSGDPDGRAFAINDRGQAIGVSGNCTTTSHGLLWQNDTVTDLGNLGGTSTFPLDINNRGQVVGLSSLPDDATFHAFLWQDGVMTDLGALPGDLRAKPTALTAEARW